MTDNQEIQEVTEPLRWRVGGASARPDRAIIVLAIAITTGWVGFKLLGHALFGLLGFAMIMASTTEAWWGTRYELNQRMAKSTTGISTTSIAWQDVQRVLPGEREVTLSPLPKDSTLAPFRGVTLRYGSAGKEAVLAAITQFGGDHVRQMG